MDQPFIPNNFLRRDPNSIQNFLADEGPWTGPGQRVPAGRRPCYPGTMLPPSEPVPIFFQDSAYGSNTQAHGSQLSASVFSDQAQSSQPSTSVFSDQASVGELQWSAYKQKQCSQCYKTFKTNAELNKHINRHERPFRCDVPLCTNTKGFPTSNELSRHKKSLHADSTPNAVYHRCPDCNNSKRWSRLDNLRAHLKSVHNNYYTMDELRRTATLPVLQHMGPADSSLPSDWRPPLLLSQAAEVLPGNQTADLIAAAGQSAVFYGIDSLPPSDPQYATDASFGIPGGGMLSAGAVLLPHIQQVISDTERQVQPGNVSPAPDGSVDGMESSLQIGNHSGIPEENRGELTPHDNVDDDMYDSPHGAVEDAGYSDNDDNENGAMDLKQGDIVVAMKQLCDAFTDRVSDADIQVIRELAQSHRGLRAAFGIDAREHVDSPDPATEEPDPVPTAAPAATSDEPPPPTEGMKPAENANGKHFTCIVCGKTVLSNSSLKKHKMRHKKPYECTIRGCGKSSGSKNDWKRHESSRHFKLETWKCQEPWVPDDGPVRVGKKDQKLCSKAFYVLDEFTAHLRQEHGMVNTERLDEKAKNYRSGQKHERNRGFWCGFCRAVVDGPAGGRSALADGQAAADVSTDSATAGEEVKKEFDKFVAWRADHIEKHFLGLDGETTKTMDDWVEEHQGRKRKRPSDDAGSRSSRPKKRKPVLWYCCICSLSANYRDSMCCNCNHAQCDNCTAE